MIDNHYIVYILTFLSVQSISSNNYCSQIIILINDIIKLFTNKYTYYIIQIKKQQQWI